MWHVNKCEQVGRVVGFSKVGAPECQSILKVGGWILAAVKEASEEGEWLSEGPRREVHGLSRGTARKQPRGERPPWRGGGKSTCRGSLEPVLKSYDRQRRWSTSCRQSGALADA